MPVASNFSILCILMIGITLIGSGLILIKRGFWPRRKGTEPQCRVCGYSLIGIASDRCPECGAVLSQLNIIYGRRQARGDMGFIGTMFLLLGIAALTPLVAGNINTINWHHFEPTYFVMRDLRSSSATTADEAMQELNRRDKANDLSSKYQQQIIEMALAQQATNAQGTLITHLIEFLEHQYMAGTMTEVQKTRFGQQCVILSLHIRPIVVAGDDVPFQIGEQCRVASPELFWVQVLDADKIEIDRNIVRQGDSGEGSFSGLGAGGAMGSTLKSPPVGQHEVTIYSHFELHGGTFGSTDPKDMLFCGEQKLTGTFEVVAQSQARDFTVINDPTLGGPIKASIQPTHFTIGAADRTSLRGKIHISALPANVAFDLFVRFNGIESKLGTITAGKNYNGDWEVSGKVVGIGATTQPTAFDLILRSSEKAARQTTDLHDIWSGELIYPNILPAVDPAR